MLYDAFEEGGYVNEFAFNKVLDNEFYNYKYQNEIFEASQTDHNFTYINMINILCSVERCSVANENNQLYYYDSGHLTKIGAKYLGDKIKFENVLPSFIYAE